MLSYSPRHENQAPRLLNFFMLNSAEHEILNAHKYKNIKKISIFQAHMSIEWYFPANKY